MLTHQQRILSAAEVCGRARLQIAAGSRVLKVDAWNEAYWQPYPKGIAGQFTDCSVTIVESDEQVIELAKRRGCDCELLSADVRQLPLADASFDAAIIANTFAGWSDESTAEAMAEMQRVLKPDGKLFVAVPPAGRIPVRIRDGSRRIEFPAMAEMLFQQGDGVFDAEQG